MRTFSFDTEGLEKLEIHISIPYTGMSHVFPWTTGMVEHMTELASKGWQLYYINFMFEPLSGSMPEKIRQMKRAITKFYGRFCTEFVNDPRSASQQQFMPQLWLFLDRPGWKVGNQSIREVKFNAGIHFNGVMAIPLFSHFISTVESSINAKEALFRSKGGSRIHIEPIKNNLLSLSDYQTKTIKWYRASADDILILPRRPDELPGKLQVMDPEIKKIKDIQSALNVDDKTARELVRSTAFLAQR